MSPPSYPALIWSDGITEELPSVFGFTQFLLSQPLQKPFPEQLVLLPARSWHQTGKVSCLKCPGGLDCCSQVLARRHTVGSGLCSV